MVDKSPAGTADHGTSHHVHSRGSRGNAMTMKVNAVSTSDVRSSTFDKATVFIQFVWIGKLRFVCATQVIEASVSDLRIWIVHEHDVSAPCNFSAFRPYHGVAACVSNVNL